MFHYYALVVCISPEANCYFYILFCLNVHDGYFVIKNMKYENVNIQKITKKFLN